MKKIERIKREVAYEGHILTVYNDTIIAPNGDVENYDTVHHRMGAAATVAVTDDEKIVLVRQYRNALDRETLEIPAGARDALTEDTIVTAERELKEETGYSCKSIKLLCKLRTTVAFCDEFIDIYLAKGLSKGEQNLDPEEDIDVEEYKLSDLLEMIYKGELQDSKTVSGILAYANMQKP
ncbi:MAG: NUDIX hydrolase [Lachnospiraceae bacterium]|nr:NUDIX hydrolase [Lachnospiraceae bacterium]